MDKYEAYRKLFELKAVGVEVSDYVRELCKLDEVPPHIVDYLCESQSIKLNCLNDTLRSKLCYKSLRSDELSENLKGASSLITHLIIESLNNPELRGEIYKEYNLESVLESIKMYFLKGEMKEFNSLVESIDRGSVK